MKIGLSLGRLSPRLWSDVSEEADQLGFESVWVPEHLVLPLEMTGSPYRDEDHPPIPARTQVFDALGYLAFLAGRTQRIRLGTAVYNIGLRHPFVTARSVTTLDVVSGGRAEFGIGASWLEAEWTAVGLDFARRGRLVDEAIDICRRLWSDEVIEHHGQFFDFGPVMFEPKPVQPGGPPVHIGGDGAAALRRVARVGTGWLPMNHTLEELPASIARLTELCEAHGRVDKIEVTVSGDVRNREDIARYADAGVDRVIVRPWRRSEDALELVRFLAAEVIDAAPTV